MAIAKATIFSLVQLLSRVSATRISTAASHKSPHLLNHVAVGEMNIIAVRGGANNGPTNCVEPIKKGPYADQLRDIAIITASGRII